MALDEKALKEGLAALQKDDSRKFKQSYDLIVALKDLNLKNPDEQVEFFASVHKTVGKKRVICALVGPEMVDDAKKVFDHVVTVAEFDKLGKKEMKKLASECHYFVGQANVMPKIAGAWGRILGPRGKMPNPKAGCIVPPKAPLAPLYARLQKMIKVSAKKSPSIQVLIGTQEMDEADVLDNIKTIYDQIIHHLPKEENNVKAAMIKLTMSKPIKVK
jgi:large subunit ribosomal protein L1